MWKKFKKSLEVPESYISMGLGLLVVIVAGLLLFNFLRANRGKAIQTTQNQSINQETQGKPVLSLPSNYKVDQGDSLWTIAEKYYHSGYNWVTIASANKLENPNIVVVGQVLSIPNAEVISPIQKNTSTMPLEKIEGSSYTVVKGDDLWQIALRTYGDAHAWIKIAEANKLDNPNLIHTGNVLKIPR